MLLRMRRDVVSTYSWNTLNIPTLDIENIVQVTSPIGAANHSPDNGSMFTNLNLLSPVQIGLNGKKVIDPTLVRQIHSFLF